MYAHAAHGDLARMVKDVIDAYIARDADKANGGMDRDKELDEMY